MSEENKNHCPKYDKGRLKTLGFFTIEFYVRKRYFVDVKNIRFMIHVFTISGKPRFTLWMPIMASNLHDLPFVESE